MTSLLDRLLGRPEPVVRRSLALGVTELPTVKAVTGAGVTAYYNDAPLSSWYDTPQSKAAAFLRAYKCGWFYKAERKISNDIASLDWSVSDGDVEAEQSETVIAHPDLDIPFDNLAPIEQLIRLLERPNPFQTGKQLIQKTQIRRDMAGTAFWYLENGDFGLPTALYGISPARMWESRNAQGERIGWVMDKDRPSGGVPFGVDEILPFPMASADDDDAFGVGVVESVFAELPLTDAMAKHTTDLLTTGGRLAGMISPKDRALSEDEFADAIRAWRNVASDPNAARRLLLFPEPMEYSAGASTPAQIGIPELASLNRDNILTAFPVAPEMLGVPMPSGMNASGESRQQLRSFYWADTIHPRIDDLKEAIQVGLLSRYEKVDGKTYDFDFDEPDLDDASAIIEKVGALKGLVSVGFDPTEAVRAAGLDHIKWLGLPAIMDPAKQLQMQQQAQAAQAQAQPSAETVTLANSSRRGPASSESIPIAKSEKSRREARDRATETAAKDAQTTIGAFLEDQRTRLAERIRATMPQTKAARKALPEDWWDGSAEDEALRESLRGLYLAIGRESLQIVADEIGRIVMPGHVKSILADLLVYGGDRITNINEVTRDAVKAQLAEGVRRGYSINQLIEGVASESYPGLAGAILDNGTAAFDPYRAELISRTETALSFNRAAISGYGQFGVKYVQAIDGDGDEQCAERNGREFTIEDAYGIEDHPNGTLDWVPVLDKAVHDPHDAYRTLATKALDALAQKPEIHVHLADTNVTSESPIVNVTNEMPALSVVNEVAVPSVTVQNDVKTPAVNVTNEVVTPVVKVTVPTPEVTITNEVVSPSVTVNNDVKVPTVTVDAPIVNVTNEVVTPTVNVAAPEVNVTTPEVTVNLPPPAPRTVTRDAKGRITGLE